MDPSDWTVDSVRRWARLVDLVAARLKRPLYFTLCFSAPVWAALAVEVERPSQMVLFGGLGLVSILLGVFGLMGLLDRQDPLADRISDPPALAEWKAAARQLHERER